MKKLLDKAAWLLADALDWWRRLPRKWKLIGGGSAVVLILLLVALA